MEKVSVSTDLLDRVINKLAASIDESSLYDDELFYLVKQLGQAMKETDPLLSSSDDDLESFVDRESLNLVWSMPPGQVDTNIYKETIEVVKRLRMVDRFNHHMDMHGRSDLVCV